MFEVIQIDNQYRNTGEPSISIFPDRGVVQFNTISCSRHKVHQYKYAMVLRDIHSNKLAILLSNKDGTKNCLTIRPNVQPASTTAQFVCRQMVDLLGLTRTTKYPYTMEAVTVNIGDGEPQPRECIVIDLSKGAQAAMPKKEAQ